MNDKHTRQEEPFVFVNAKIWTGVDIPGVLAVPKKEFEKFLSDITIDPTDSKNSKL
jgi:hypothetical protein